MRVLVLCYEYPPVGGGGGRVAAGVAEGLVRLGHEVRVHTAGLRHLPARERRDGVLIHRTPSFRKREESCTVAEMGLYVATATGPASALACTWRPDVIHAHFAMPTGPVAWVASRASRVPYVLTAHLGDVPGGVPAQTDRMFRVVGPFARRIWRDASAATAVSTFVHDLAAAAYAREVTMIPNGIARGPEPDTRVHDPVRLVFAGRFNPQKNLPFLIEALACVPHNLAWTLDLVGAGPDLDGVRSSVKARGLQDRIRFHGWLEGDAATRIMRDANILLLPSLAEGLPVVGVQALDAGLAIVGSRIPGLLDVLKDGVNGLALPTEGAAAFGAGLGALIANPPRIARMRTASREHAARFDLDRIVRDYESVLARAAGLGLSTRG